MNRLSMCAVALGAALLAVPQAAQANFLLNGSLEATVTVGSSAGGFPVPAPPNTPDFDKRIAFQHWAASAYNALGGMEGFACPAAFGAGCSDKGSYVASMQSDVTASGLPRPVAMYQTVDLQAGAYRFGGDVAMAMWAVAVGDNESEAFLRIYAGEITFGSGGAPNGASGALLASIDLSPAQFAMGDFSITLGDGAFRGRQFETFEGLFTLDSDTLVTMQLVILPKRDSAVTAPPYSNTGEAGRSQASSLTLWADNFFIEATRIQPVPAPGALGVFAVALAGLALARRRSAA